MFLRTHLLIVGFRWSRSLLSCHVPFRIRLFFGVSHFMRSSSSSMIIRSSLHSFLAELSSSIGSKRPAAPYYYYYYRLPMENLFSFCCSFQYTHGLLFSVMHVCTRVRSIQTKKKMAIGPTSMEGARGTHANSTIDR